MNLVRHDLSTAFETGLNPTNVRVSSNQLISSRTSPQLCTSKSTVCNHISHVDEKKKTHIEPIRRHDLESSFSVGKTPRTVATKRERQNCCKISRENGPEHGSSDSLTSHTTDIHLQMTTADQPILFFFPGSWFCFAGSKFFLNGFFVPGGYLCLAVSLFKLSFCIDSRQVVSHENRSRGNHARLSWDRIVW